MKLLLPVFFSLVCHNPLVKVYIHTITRVITSIETHTPPTFIFDYIVATLELNLCQDSILIQNTLLILHPWKEMKGRILSIFRHRRSPGSAIQLIGFPTIYSIFIFLTGDKGANQS